MKIRPLYLHARGRDILSMRDFRGQAIQFREVRSCDAVATSCPTVSQRLGPDWARTLTVLVLKRLPCYVAYRIGVNCTCSLR